MLTSFLVFCLAILSFELQCWRSAAYLPILYPHAAGGKACHRLTTSSIHIFFSEVPLFFSSLLHLSFPFYIFFFFLESGVAFRCLVSPLHHTRQSEETVEE